MMQHFLPELLELQQAKNTIAASEEAGVKYATWSSLPKIGKPCWIYGHENVLSKCDSSGAKGANVMRCTYHVKRKVVMDCT
jgi:hypothetical protein